MARLEFFFHAIKNVPKGYSVRVTNGRIFADHPSKPSLAYVPAFHIKKFWYEYVKAEDSVLEQVSGQPSEADQPAQHAEARDNSNQPAIDNEHNGGAECSVADLQKTETTCQL